LIVEQGPQKGQQFDLAQPNTVIGRASSPEVQISIPSPEVSRQHAQITRVDDSFYLTDLGSSNGTFLNGERLGSDPVVLQLGDQIQLSGTITFVLKPPVSVEEPPPIETPESGPAETIMGEELEALKAERPSTPPELVVSTAGEGTRTYSLTAPSIRLGRSEKNDIVIGVPTVSRSHARLERVDSGYKVVVLPQASNPVLLAGRPVQEERHLHHGDTLRIGVEQPGMMVTMTYRSATEAAEVEQAMAVQLGEKNLLQIGRDPRNDVVLEAPNVSRFHAQIERVGQRYRVLDLRSSNGTFVNDQRIEADVWLNPDDTIRIGPYRFVMGKDELAQFDETSGLRADAIKLNKWVQKDFNILQDISVVFKPREFIVIVGQSGGGKSTLLDAIAGYRPATHGRVFVNDIDVYRNFDAVRNNIGYVPQRDIIHMELTVYQALDYAAQLRMPPDTSEQERHQRIMEVLHDLDLAHRKDVQVSGLSGGQQKRVSIGVELLTQPGLFFLDEATSGLDPGTETSLMQLLRRLADQGRTIVLVTHATKNVMLADKVLFLARGGYLAWFGPPDEALAYFDQFRSARDRRTSSIEFDDIYAILDDPGASTPEQWADRFRRHRAHKTYIEQPLDDRFETPPGEPEKEVEQSTPEIMSAGREKVSALRQFLILSHRNLRILTRDRISLALMLGSAPLVSMLDVLIAVLMGRDQFDFLTGSAENVFMPFFLLIIFAVFVGGLSQMREIVKELDIYKRERLVNLKITPYVFSKVWVAALLALYHGAAYVTIHYIAYKMGGGALEFGMMYVTMALVAMAGMMLGLFTSAVSPSANTAPMIMILLMMPQIVLSGSLVPLPSSVSAPASTRWAFEAMMGISGVGADIASDPCWDLPEDLREVMSIEDKTEHCTCMGLNLLREEICSFPGVGKYYDSAIEEPAPEKPAELREKPAEPEIPPAPEKPEDESDSVAMADYFEAMEAYQEETEQIQDEYKTEMKAYEAEADIYQAEMEAYQEQQLEWEIARAKAVDSAEGLVESFNEEFGWTFIDKENPRVFASRTAITWAAQGLIILLLLGGVLLIVKRKDHVQT
jgi:ABC-type multidrug transport system ATPase subunit/pSer/pThr/pTyr-binding forkhead associated (FHA) protein